MKDLAAYIVAGFILSSPVWLTISISMAVYSLLF